MRLLSWNIAYGTGGPSSFTNQITRWHNYVFTSPYHLKEITNVVREATPDITALIEVDMGSFRSRFINQAQYIARDLSQQWKGETKYGLSALSNKIPILRQQGNAVVSALPMKMNNHYFPRGMKKLVIDTDFGDFRLIVVHLALTRRTREHQLHILSELLPRNKPMIICGDFNTLSKSPELIEFKRKLELYSFNEAFLPTFPAFAPDKELDYILASHSIQLHNFRVIPTLSSDHLPLLADFSV